MDVTFDENFAKSLAFALKTNVIGLQTDFQFGDLHRLDDPHAAFWQLKATYDWQHQTALALMVDLQEKVAQLHQAVAAGESLRVWWSEGTDDRLGLYWLSSLLTNPTISMTQVKVPIAQARLLNGQSVFQEMAALGELTSEDATRVLPLTEPLDAPTRLAYSYAWRGLVDENAPLRVNLNGHITGVGVDFYDRFLVSQEQPDWTTQRVIGETLGRYPVGIPEWWYAYRLDVLRRQKRED